MSGSRNVAAVDVTVGGRAAGLRRHPADGIRHVLRRRVDGPAWSSTRNDKEAMRGDLKEEAGVAGTVTRAGAVTPDEDWNLAIWGVDGGVYGVVGQAIVGGPLLW